MILVSSCICLCLIYWSLVLSREWRWSWSSADRRCSNYIWEINYKGATYIRDLTVILAMYCIFYGVLLSFRKPSVSLGQLLVKALLVFDELLCLRSSCDGWVLVNMDVICMVMGEIWGIWMTGWNSPVLTIFHKILRYTPSSSPIGARHYNDVIMGTVVSQNTSLAIVYSTVYSGAAQRKHESSASLAIVREFTRDQWIPPQKWPVTWKMFPFDDVIMKWGVFCEYKILLMSYLCYCVIMQYLHMIDFPITQPRSDMKQRFTQCFECLL